MTHSFRAHYYHLIWSTKNREPLIINDIQPSLYTYIGGIIKNHEGTLLGIGGTFNHVHILVGLKLPDKFSDFIREIKAGSSLWVNKNLPSNQYFAWQEGYGSFSVSYSLLEKVQYYIANQEEHHKVITFEEEYHQLLNKHQLKFDSRFVLG